MRRVFNLGIGFVLVVRPRDVQIVSSILGNFGETVYVIGEVAS